MTLIQRFWQRVFNRSSDSHIVLVGDNGELVRVSWKQAGYAVATLMSFLRQKGVTKGDKVAILGWNSPEWVWANLAIQSIGATTVSIYPNSKPDSVNYILKDSGAKFTFVDDPEQGKKVANGAVIDFADVVPALAPNTPKSRFLCWFLDDLYTSQVLRFHGVNDELSKLRLGREPGKDFCELADDDLAVIIYTSGSSGTPKGCMISHGNLAAKMQAMAGVGLGFSSKTDRGMSYLPLAHVLANIDEMGQFIWEGVEFGFSPVEQMAENLKKIQPTMISGVPAVWEKIYQKALNPPHGIGKVLNLLRVWKPIFKAALRTDSKTRIGKLCDRVIFSKVREQLGGKLRFGVSGGAAASAEVLHFCKRIGIEIIEGYGATETLGGIITNRPSWAAGNGPKNKVGTVGYAVPGAEVRIYMIPGEEDMGAGEIQVRSAQVFKGYLNMPEATAEAFMDGWFRTGDLGKIDADGFVSITGRLNGMEKNANGKYVPREKIEMAFKPFPIVHYILPQVKGRKYVAAFIFVNQEEAAKLVGKAPAGVDAAKFYAENAQVKKAVAEAVAAANSSLEKWESVGRFEILPIAPTLENGIVTETLKIRSKVLLKRFEKEFDELYARSDNEASTGGGAFAWFFELLRKLTAK